MKKYFFLTIIAVFAAIIGYGQLLAFPTAEGAGKFVTGGRGNTSSLPVIYFVTNLGDVNTAGSFRYACTNGTTAPRIVIFRVSGTIKLTSALSLNKANTTIAGQTAPGEGICIADYPVTINADNMIIRYLRFRLGDKNQLKTTPSGCGIPLTPFNYTSSCYPTVNSSGNDDAFGDNGGGKNNIIVDHCSVSWSNDEAFTMYRGNNITLQWNILSEPLNYSYHVETGDIDYELHGYGGIWGGANSTMHHNLLAHCKGRMPRFDGIRNIASELVDFRNNVIYNWGDYNTNGGEGGKYNIVNNYYKYGPNTNSAITAGINKRNMLINPYKKTSAPTIPYGQYFLNGNYCDNSAAVTADNWQGVAFNNGTPVGADLTAMQMVTAHTVTNSINTQSAIDAYNAVLSNAGCVLPNRDTLDLRIINDVKNRTGGLIDVQGNQPAHVAAPSNTPWPTLATGTAQTDTDLDGMPDAWETARGLNANIATDRNGYISTSGYNNIENYINGDTIVAVGRANTCIETKKINSTNTAQWLYARDSIFSTFNSAYYTSAMDSNQIAAAILDDGNFGEFTISYYSNSTNRSNGVGLPYGRRNITITPTNPALITAPVTVRLYFSLAEFNALKAADPSIATINDIAILKTSDNTCTTAIGASYTTIIPTIATLFGTYQNGFYVEFQTTSFSTFFFASKNNALLPVTLKSFEVAKGINTNANITWTTAQEINSNSFEIQRSTNNTNWKTIATQNAAGYSNSTLNYSYTDEAYKNGIYYYRLKQNDNDGIFTYSDIKKIAFNSFAQISIFPNPVKSSVEIKLTTAANYKLELFDATGKLVLTKNINNTTNIDLSKFNNGVYIAKISTNNESDFYKILISK
jgi:Secretion system C-terminal sorting domain